MILLIILAIIAVLATVITVVAVSIFGTGALIMFGDVIVCIVVIGFIIKKIIQKRRGRW